MTHQVQETPETVTLSPAAPATASVIWLHGLGADGRDFLPIVPELKLPASPAIRFIFPHAPIRPVTLNGGMRMRAWYDIKELSREGRADAEGVRASAKQVEGLIAQEREAGIAAKNIVLAGFSQGGAIGLHVALRHPERLGGLLALSTYLLFEPMLRVEKSAANQDLPILMCHGTHDPVLPLNFGELSRDALRAQGYTVEWKAYPMQHQVCMEEIQDIAAWLRGVLK